MCHATDARPPFPPIAGGAGAAGSQSLTLEASDGNRFRAFSARAADPNAPGVMILPDIRGLHPYYEELAVRFAESGVHAVALDYFGRTLGLDEPGDDVDFMSHVLQMTPEGVGADTAAALAHLRSPDGGAAARTYSVGFCLGGRISFNQAARDHGLAGVVGFYGGPQGRGPDDESAPIRWASSYKTPVLGLFGGADPGIPVESVDQFRAALEAAGVGCELVVYPGAPHSFFDRSFDDHKDACDDAWRRVLSFVLGS